MCTGLVAPRHAGSSPTGDRTRVPCIGRRILNHRTTREVPGSLSILLLFVLYSYSRPSSRERLSSLDPATPPHRGPTHILVPPPSGPSVRFPWLHRCLRESPAAQKVPAKTSGKNRVNAAPALHSGQGQSIRGSAPLSPGCTPRGSERGAVDRAWAAGASRLAWLRLNCR